MSAHADEQRAVNALHDVVAIETVAPDLVKVVTWSDAYHVDARDAGCNCPDHEYNIARDEMCKHEVGALLAESDRYPTPFVTDDLDARTVADGGKRPPECECIPDDDLPCAACAINGFETTADT